MTAYENIHENLIEARVQEYLLQRYKTHAFAGAIPLISWLSVYTPVMITGLTTLVTGGLALFGNKLLSSEANVVQVTEKINDLISPELNVRAPLTEQFSTLSDVTTNSIQNYQVPQISPVGPVQVPDIHNLPLPAIPELLSPSFDTISILGLTVRYSYLYYLLSGIATVGTIIGAYYLYKYLTKVVDSDTKASDLETKDKDKTNFSEQMNEEEGSKRKRKRKWEFSFLFFGLDENKKKKILKKYEKQLHTVILSYFLGLKFSPHMEKSLRYKLRRELTLVLSTIAVTHKSLETTKIVDEIIIKLKEITVSMLQNNNFNLSIADIVKKEISILA